MTPLKSMLEPVPLPSGDGIPGFIGATGETPSGAAPVPVPKGLPFESVTA